MVMNSNLVTIPHIQSRILTIRDQQVMLDRDLAELYGVATKSLNQAVKRNATRFPDHFRFQLSKNELDEILPNRDRIASNEGLRSQIVTSKRGGNRYATYAFSEQGIAMLSTVLRSETAVQTSIRIMDAFVAMRRFIVSNAQLFRRVDALETRQMESERKQLETEKKVDEIFERLGTGDVQPKQGVFFDGQIFDAYLFVSKLLKSAKRTITLVDNYIDETTLQLFSVCSKSVAISVYTRKISANVNLAVAKFNSQYAQVVLKQFAQSHDRFLIIDGTVYHFGASLKDLGKKWFAFSKMALAATEIESRLA